MSDHPSLHYSSAERAEPVRSEAVPEAMVVPDVFAVAPHGTTDPITHEVAEALLPVVQKAIQGSDGRSLAKWTDAREGLPVLLWAIAREETGDADRLRLAFVPYEDLNDASHEPKISVRILNTMVNPQQMERWLVSAYDLMTNGSFDLRSFPTGDSIAPECPTIIPIYPDLFIDEVVKPAKQQQVQRGKEAETVLDWMLGLGMEDRTSKELRALRAAEDMKLAMKYPRRTSIHGDQPAEKIVEIFKNFMDILDASNGASETLTNSDDFNPSDRNEMPVLPFKPLPTPLHEALIENQNLRLQHPLCLDFNTATLCDLAQQKPYLSYVWADRWFCHQDDNSYLIANLNLDDETEQAIINLPARWRIALAQGLLHPAAREMDVIEALRQNTTMDTSQDVEWMAVTDTIPEENNIGPDDDISDDDDVYIRPDDDVLDDDDDDVSKEEGGAEPMGIQVERYAFKPCTRTIREFAGQKLFNVLADATPLISIGHDPWDWQDAMDLSFPWMSEVTARVVRRLSIQLAHGLPLHLPTLALMGDSGVGKTLYWHHAMTVLNHPFTVQNMGGANDSVVIKGTTAGWSTESPGLAARTMASFKCGNPVVLLDEIDKAGGDSKNGKVMDALLALLEPSTNKTYHDDCLQQTVDTSHISWLLTLNDESKLSPEVRGRIEIVEVKGPDWTNPKHVEAALVMGETCAWEAWPSELATHATRLSDAQKNVLRATRWKSLRSLGQTIRGMIEENLYHDSLGQALAKRGVNGRATWRPTT